jgi:phosphatidylglycerophosphate synthase
MEPRYDGFISRYLNRRFSDPVARLLARTPLTPNQASLGAAAVGVLSFVSFLLGQNIVGGILVQLSSIADGVDGELARIKGMASPFGGFLDSVLDRYVDALVVLGMTIWAAGHETYPGIWIAGFLALVGTLCTSYTRARVPEVHRNLFDRGLTSAASRDVRLFLVMLGGILGQAYIFLLVLAVLTNLTVLNRLAVGYLHLHGRKTEPPREVEGASARQE